MLHRDRAHSANCTEDRRFHGAVFWVVVDMPVGVQTTGFGQTVQKTVVPQLHSSDKVVDVPAVAVHRQGVDVPVIIQRRSLQQLRCLRFRSSPESVGILLYIRDGYYGSDEGLLRRILRHFSRSSGCPGVERQFFEFSSAHNCECSMDPGVPESPGVYSQVTRHRDCQFILM